MHCDVLRPGLPIAGFLLVFGLTVVFAQRRAPRSRARLALGVGSLLLAVLATASVPSVACEVQPSPPTAPRAALVDAPPSPATPPPPSSTGGTAT